MSEPISGFETEIQVGEEVLIIKTHAKPHFDEIAAIVLIDWCATKEWLKKWCPDNVLHLGIGGGWADDHSDRFTEEESAQMSSFSLVAESLGVFDNPEIEHIKKYVLFEDNHRSKEFTSLARVFWLMQQMYPEKENDNIAWAIEGLMAKFNDRNLDFTVGYIAELDKAGEDMDVPLWLKTAEKTISDYQEEFEKALLEYREKASSRRVLVKKIRIAGKVWPVVAIRSDSLRMSAVLRYYKGANAGVAIIQNSRGGYLIAVNQKSRASLDEAVAVIRVFAQKKRNSLITRDWKTLRSKEEVPGVEEWHYHKIAKFFYNGSLTHPDVEPTNLTYKEVFSSVCLGLDRSQFHPKCNGKTCLGKGCSFYQFGLSRCRTTRYNAK